MRRRNFSQLSPLLMTVGPEETPGGEAGGDEGAKPEVTPEETSKKPQTKPEDNLGDAGKKAIKAERERAKAAEDRAKEAEARVKAFEDAQKTQEQRDTERREAQEKESRENSIKVLKYEAAEQTGIPLKAAMRLKGETLEELVADAEELKELGIGTPATPTPKPDQSQGRSGGKTQHSNVQDAISAHYAQQ